MDTQAQTAEGKVLLRFKDGPIFVLSHHPKAEEVPC